MENKKILSKKIIKNIICTILLIIFAILSMTVVAKYAVSTENYTSTIKSIDEKKVTVMGISATAAVISTALAAVPGDATNPVANQIMNLSSYLFWVVCVLVLEKSLLPIMGYVSFKFLMPVVCLLLGISIFSKKGILKILAFKIMAFALVIVSIIPVSVKIGDIICETNKITIEQVTVNIDKKTDIEKSEKNKSLIDGFLDKTKKAATDIGEKSKQILNNFIDAIAIFVIAYCAIPIITVFLFIWFVNFLFGLSIPIPKLGSKKKTDKNTHEGFGSETEEKLIGE